MNLYHRIISVLLCAALMLCLTACTSDSAQADMSVEEIISEAQAAQTEQDATEENAPAEESAPIGQDTMSIVFSEKYLKVADVSPEDWVESLNDLGSGQYVDLYVSGDGQTVTLEITETHQSFWMGVVEYGLEKLKEDFSGISSTYKVEYSSDYRCLDFYYDLDLPVTDAMYYIIYFEVYCAFGQMLNGVASNSWYVSASIYNSDTGKLVTSGDSEAGLEYEASDWEASE